MGKSITIKNFSFAYTGSKNQLRNINLCINSGEVIVLTGTSGSGKSSLTRVINGLIPYFFEGELIGEIKVDKMLLKDIPSWRRGKIVGNVFQDPRSQFFANQVAGEIAFGCENYGYTHDEICNKVNCAAKNMKIEDILDYNIHNLSYGMRQKVAIASAQAIDPDIYVMDEPSANLDIESTYRFGEIIKKLKDKGKTIIIAEHRLYYLMEVADRFLFVKNGSIQREFSNDEMKNITDNDIHSMGLRSPDLYKIEFTEKQLERRLDVVLEAKKIYKSFGDVLVAKGIDFSCKKGEIIAIIGPNGTGKSTLGRIFAGLQKESSGEVILFGKKSKPKERLGKVWYIPQDLDSQLFGENLMDELLTGNPITEKRKERAKSILTQLQLLECCEQHPSTLSGGQKQRLALGVALMHEAPIIILDEPTSGLDGYNMRNVSHMIQKLSKMGHTILLITHDAECVLACCQRAIRLENGYITDDFRINSLPYLLEKIGY